MQNKGFTINIHLSFILCRLFVVVVYLSNPNTGDTVSLTSFKINLVSRVSWRSSLSYIYIFFFNFRISPNSLPTDIVCLEGQRLRTIRRLTNFKAGGHGHFGLVRVGVRVVERHVVPEQIPLVDGLQVAGARDCGHGARHQHHCGDHCCVFFFSLTRQWTTFDGVTDTNRTRKSVDVISKTVLLEKNK